MTARTLLFWICSLSAAVLIVSGGCREPGPVDDATSDVDDTTGDLDDTTGGPDDTPGPVDDTPAPVDDPPVASSRFRGAATRGDVITYEIEDDKQSYAWTNETTGLSGEGTYTTLAANEHARGFFELTEGDQTYYGLKLAEDVVITNNPAGHVDNKLAVVLKAEAPEVGVSLAGDYLYIWMNDGNTELRWGATRIGDDGSFTYHGYDSARPEDVGELLFDGTGAGTWAFVDSDTGEVGRVEFTTDTATLVGMVLPGRAFVLDQGEGEGLWIGMRVPDAHLTVSEVVGIYQYMDLSYEDPTATSLELGLFRVNEGSTVDRVSLLGADLTDPSSWDRVDGLSLAAIDNVNNMFKVTNAQGLEAYLVFVAGETVLHFDFQDGLLVRYGAGVWQAAAQ